MGSGAERPQGSCSQGAAEPAEPREEEQHSLLQPPAPAQGPCDALLAAAAAAGNLGTPLLPRCSSIAVPHFRQAYNWCVEVFLGWSALC